MFAGSRLPVRTPSLLVGVNAYDPQLFAIRRPDLDRGELFVRRGQARQSSRLRLVRLPCRIPRPDEDADFDLVKLHDLEVRARTSRLPVACDGELLRLRPPLRYRIRPGALLVLAPPAATG